MNNGLEKVKKKQVIKQFLYSRIFFFACIQVLLNGFSKKGLEIANLSIERKILDKLRKKYKHCIDSYAAEPCVNSAKHSNKIWVCWLQGMDAAPVIIQKCYKSLRHNITGREIVLLTEENYREYISFPDYIEEKIASGAITKTHLTDLMRIELLTSYGGTWIDATVFCSGENIPEILLDSDLFMFQILKPGLSGHPTRVSSWFMTANANSDILNLTKVLLYAYWKSHSSMVSYFLLHDFIELAIESYPKEWNRVIKISNGSAHVLQYALDEVYNDTEYSAIIQGTCFHKLTYKTEYPDDPRLFVNVLFKE